MPIRILDISGIGKVHMKKFCLKTENRFMCILMNDLSLSSIYYLMSIPFSFSLWVEQIDVWQRERVERETNKKKIDPV